MSDGPTPINITRPRGDTWTIKFGPITEEGVLVNLTGAKAWLTVKDDPDDTDVNAVIQITEVLSASGQVTFDVPTGIATCVVKPAVTRIAARAYAIDFQIKYNGDKIGTPALGTIRVTKDSSHAIT